MGVTIWLKGASDSNPQIQIYPKLWNMFFLVFPKLFTFGINDCFLSHKKTVVFLKYLLRSNPRAIWSARVGQQVSRRQKEELDIQKCTAIKSYFLSFRMLELRAPSRPLGSAVSDSCLPSSGLSGPPPSYKIRTLLFLSTTMCQLSLASALFSSFNPGWNHSHDFQLTAGSGAVLKNSTESSPLAEHSQETQCVLLRGNQCFTKFESRRHSSLGSKSGELGRKKGRNILISEWKLLLEDTPLFQKELKTECRISWTKIFMIWRTQEVFSCLSTYSHLKSLVSRNGKRLWGIYISEPASLYPSPNG